MIYATALLLAELTQFSLHWGTHTYIKSRLQWDWSGQQFAMQRCAVPMVNGGVGVPSRRLGTLAVNWPWWFGFSGLSCSRSYLYMFFTYVIIYLLNISYMLCIFILSKWYIKKISGTSLTSISGIQPRLQKKAKISNGCPSWTNQHDRIEVTIRWYDWVKQFGPKIFQN